jgi:N-acetyl-anhydromuramyl-L-alanine amidase AmpD
MNPGGVLNAYRAWPVLFSADGNPRFCYWGVKERPTIRTWAPSEIVLHYTSGGVFDRDVAYITSRNARAISVHFTVGPAGQVVLCTPLQYVAWHAGHWGHNKRSIGIELCHPNDDSAYPETQLDATITLCAELCSLFRIDPWTGIVGHRDIVTTLCPRGLDVREVAGCVAVEMVI